MTWQNPWALLGLAALAVPVFIHLLSRKRAVLQKFPTLRFLNATRLLPTRSPHLTDIPLLLVRLGILVIATLALTQPLWMSAARTQAFNSAIARVIIVDTSASMQRARVGGGTAVDSARAAAQAIASESQGSLVVETATPSQAFAGASAWLTAQGVRGEVVVVSDFQHGTVDGASVGRVAAGFGVRMVKVSVPSTARADSGFRTTSGVVLASADSTSTRAEWTNVGAVASDSAVLLLAPSGARDAADAAARAAFQVAPRGLADTARPTAVVLDGASEQAAIVSSARVPDKSWMARAMLAVQDDRVLADAAGQVAVTDTTIAAPFAVLVRTEQGRPVVYAAGAAVNGIDRLVFIHRGGASELVTPALLVAVGNATGSVLSLQENETLIIAEPSLRALERPVGESRAQNRVGELSASTNAGLSDARWFWVLVLLLLGVETWMRKRADVSAEAEAA